MRRRLQEYLDEQPRIWVVGEIYLRSYHPRLRLLRRPRDTLHAVFRPYAPSRPRRRWQAHDRRARRVVSPKASVREAKNQTFAGLFSAEAAKSASRLAHVVTVGRGYEVDCSSYCRSCPAHATPSSEITNKANRGKTVSGVDGVGGAASLSSRRIPLSRRE